MLDPLLAGMGVAEGLRRAISAPLAVVIATIISMVIGELVPKNFALAKPLQAARAVMPLQAGFTAIFKPAILVLNGSANGLLRAIGIEPKEAVSYTHLDVYKRQGRGACAARTRAGRCRP